MGMHCRPCSWITESDKCLTNFGFHLELACAFVSKLSVHNLNISSQIFRADSKKCCPLGLRREERNILRALAQCLSGYL